METRGPSASVFIDTGFVKKTQEPSCRNEIQEGLGINNMHKTGQMQSNVYTLSLSNDGL